MVGNLSRGRKRRINTQILQGRGFCDRPATCSSKKELIVILRDALRLRTERANKLTDDNAVCIHRIFRKLLILIINKLVPYKCMFYEGIRVSAF
jgi:hypothetical protein